MRFKGCERDARQDGARDPPARRLLPANGTKSRGSEDSALCTLRAVKCSLNFFHLHSTPLPETPPGNASVVIPLRSALSRLVQHPRSPGLGGAQRGSAATVALRRNCRHKR